MFGIDAALSALWLLRGEGALQSQRGAAVVQAVRSTIRADGTPSAEAVARVIASGWASLAACASSIHAASCWRGVRFIWGNL